MSDKLPETPDNPEAFPMPLSDPHGVGQVQPGMSLRDYFAEGAMRSLVSLSMNGDVPVDEDGREDARLVAENAYAVADAMLKARLK
jgi:hypothetical protein